MQILPSGPSEEKAIDKSLISLYHDIIMANVATIIRLPEDQYRHYRKLALDKNKSFTKLVEEALKQYREVKIEHLQLAKRKKTFERIWETRIPINTSVTKLIHEGRRFEDE